MSSTAFPLFSSFYTSLDFPPKIAARLTKLLVTKNKPLVKSFLDLPSF